MTTLQFFLMVLALFCLAVPTFFTYLGVTGKIKKEIIDTDGYGFMCFLFWIFGIFGCLVTTMFLLHINHLI